ncbi:dihydrofolate reductase family protein [Gordonia sp. ABSL1-1]|uniref:dihydrofolate reductase family protein n=1 Tax=Gordonia sp. ABSL1-1 TaxID=3053923 RepID=UPI0025727CD1|nr:dihydrofolate reductase family protein [Gordonia sp. ABSL1-1]MDL9937217.1 dihydrofolate reductase family protein [Gordonia sp. ABSL1-1]
MSLMVDFITSLDGYGAADGWPGWWGLETGEYLRWLDDQAADERTVLLGANTYRLMSEFATSSTEGVDALDSVDKLVFSNTLTEPLTWANSRLIRGSAVEAVRELKNTGAGSLSTLGSISLSRSLLAAGLVDRFRVVVFPVITGKTGQERIYDNYPDVALDLVEARTFEGGLQLLDYRPRMLDAPLPPGPGSAGSGSA